MHYDSPDKPWSFHPCEAYWKVGVELNRPREGIASGRGGTRPETDTDSEADAKPVADAESEAAAELRNKRADFLYHYIGRRTFSSGKKPSYHYVWGDHLIYDHSRAAVVGLFKPRGTSKKPRAD